MLGGGLNGGIDYIIIFITDLGSNFVLMGVFTGR